MNPEDRKNNPFLQNLNDNFDAFLIIAVIVIFAAAYFFVILPKYQSTITAIKDNTSQQEKIYFEQKTRLNNLKVAANLYEGIKKDQLGDIRKVNAVLPNDYVKERLFGEIEEIINKSGFLLSSLSIKREEISQDNLAGTNSLGDALPKSVGRIQMSISISAIDYAGLKNLLYTLEKNNRLLDIQSIAFSPEGKTAQLELYTYYFKSSL
ncbi:MAG: hypothetical protein NTX66_01695 [Candidatus Falkowbacteria bacterium]|nr:hypothetical protein [Candidatus Falkowbacteria bacterium]